MKNFKSGKSKKVGALVCSSALAAGVLGYGCGSSTPVATGTTITSASGGIAAASTNLQKYTPTVVDSAATSFNLLRGFPGMKGLFESSAFAGALNPFGAQWTANTMEDLYCDSGMCGPNGESIQKYIGQTLDPNFLNAGGSAVGAAGRYVNALFQSCAMSSVMTSSCGTDSDGLPPVGTCTATVHFTDVVAGGTFNGCPVPSNFSSGGGGSLSLGIAVTAVTGNANYSKKIVITGAPIGNGTGTMTQYAKIDATAGKFNLESISPGDAGGGVAAACGGSRYIIAINNGVTQFEYVSNTLGTDANGSCTANTQSHEDFYRIHIDTTGDQAYILGMTVNAVTSTNGLAFLPSGEPSKLASNSGDLAVSAFSQLGGTNIPTSGTTFDSTSASACISQSTGTLDTDDTLDCDISGIDVHAAQSLLAATSAADFVYNPPTSVTTTPASIAWTSSSDFATAVTSP